MNIRGGIIRAVPENASAFFDRLDPARGMPVSANSPNNPEPADEPEIITDLSELSFDFEEATPSNRRPALGSTTDDLTPGELSEALELLDSLAGQITGDGPPEFYCKPLGQLLGPMSLAELRIMAESGALSEDDMVRYGENGEWKPAGSFSRLAESLHRGSSITDAPVSSAPPSTRRLFQTGYKPNGDSFGEGSSKSGGSVPAEQSVAQPENAPKDVAASISVPVSEDARGVAETNAPESNSSDGGSDADDNSDAGTASESSPGDRPREKKAAKRSPAGKKAGRKSAGRKTPGKKKPSKKRNDEDDAILNDIFSEVFADDQKMQRAAMPPAAGASSRTPDAADSAPTSAVNDGTAEPAATP